MVHVHVHVHNLHCTIIFMLILGQSHIRINMHTLPFLQAITVLNHAGVCVSYQTAWKYVQQLTTEARYQEAEGERDTETCQHQLPCVQTRLAHGWQPELRRADQA